VFSPAHQLEDPSELHEVDPLLGFQRVLIEERNDPLVQMIQTTHPVSQPLLAVPANHAAPEKCLECEEQLDVPLVLDNCEFREHLEPAGHVRMRIDSDEEATFAVHESDHPLCFQFLRSRPNVKSLRVLHFMEPSLRIVPVSVGF
jgi:hypothetical protein